MTDELEEGLLSQKKMGLADSEDSEAPQMANNTLKKLLPHRDQIQDILRKQCSKGKAKNISVKSSVKTSESEKVDLQGPFRQTKGPLKGLNICLTAPINKIIWILRSLRVLSILAEVQSREDLSQRDL